MLYESFRRAGMYAAIGFSINFLVGCILIPINSDIAFYPMCLGSMLFALLGFGIGLLTGFKTAGQRQRIVWRRVEKECAKSAGNLQALGQRTIQLSDRKVSSGEKLGQAVQARFGKGTARIDVVQSIRIDCPEGEFYLVVPWSGTDMMSHEFFSVLSGKLPCSLALARTELLSFSTGGCWIGPDDSESHPIAKAANRFERRPNAVSLQNGIEWDWHKGNLKSKLDWGMQAVPISDDTYVHMIHTAQKGMFGTRLGVDWYLERRAAFVDFVSSLDLDVTPDKRIMFPAKSWEVIQGLEVGEEPPEVPMVEQVLPALPVEEAPRSPTDEEPPPSVLPVD